MIKCILVDSPIYFKSLHCDPKRDKFQSNDPVFEFTILEFSAKTKKNLHSKIGAKVSLTPATLQAPALRANRLSYGCALIMLTDFATSKVQL